MRLPKITGLLLVLISIFVSQIPPLSFALPTKDDDCSFGDLPLNDSASNKGSKVRLNAVFEGGGVRGIALVGALKKLDQEGVKFAAVGGTSAGSIVAALYAAGYTVDEIEKALSETDFSELLDPYFFSMYGIWNDYGLHKGDKLYDWIYLLLKKKGVETFADLKDIDLKIVASDLTNREILVFDRVDHKKLKVAEAVLMSSAIPIFFKAHRWGEKLVVDGGILSNYPLWIFKNSDRVTIGFKLVSDTKVRVPHPPTSLPSYFEALANTVVEAHDKADLAAVGYQNTIHISTCGVASTDFGLTREQTNKLFNSGYLAATRFFNSRGGELLR